MTISHEFSELVQAIPQIGLEWHRETLLRNSRENLPYIGKSLRVIRPNTRPVLLVCAGPSLYRMNPLRWLERPDLRNRVTLVVTDGAYIRCIRRGIIPDWVLSIDPHPSRIVRWFGDPEMEAHMALDDYFERQDLDLDFRKQMKQINEYNMRIVDRHHVPLVLCSSAPANVVQRTMGWDRYWFAPLCDDPAAGSLTSALTELTGLPAMNTGGTVGNACWVFAHAVLQSQNIACIGMDFGYAPGTPLEQTQSWNMLKNRDGVQDYYPEVQGVDGRAWFSDATYWFYRGNLLDMLKSNNASITNCTEGGILYGDGVECMSLENWFKTHETEKRLGER